jgi:hypothetical protein
MPAAPAKEIWSYSFHLIIIDEEREEELWKSYTVQP